MSPSVYILGGLVAGLLCGLIPLRVGRQSGRPELGERGLLACAIAGAIGGLILALPTAIGFAWWIRQKSTPRTLPAARADIARCDACGTPQWPSGRFCGACGAPAPQPTTSTPRAA